MQADSRTYSASDGGSAPAQLPAPPEHPLLPAPGGNNGRSERGDAAPREPGDRKPNGQKDNRDKQKGGDEHEVPVDLPEVSRGAAILIGVVLVVLFASLFLIGFLPHHSRESDTKKEATEAAGARPIVEVEKPTPSDTNYDLMLPGDVQAFQSTALYAQATGYLKPLPAGIDIGAEVKQGQLLAEISSPDIDAQLLQAKAALLQAEVTVGRAEKENGLNKATFERYAGLSETGGVTAQQLDEKKAALMISGSALKAAQASQAGAQAAVQRLAELQGFEKVVAPFDGTITARNFDAGALIAANTAGGGGGRELFHIDQTNILRVFVDVPQGYASDVRTGQEANVTVRNHPGRNFTGAVARTAGAVDMTTRTMRVEMDLPNSEHALFPGMYAQVNFKVHQEHPPLIVRTSSLLFDPKGMRMAVVKPDNKVEFRKVTVGRDFGQTAEVTAGISADDSVVSNPGERLRDGMEVQLKPHTQAAGNGQGNAPKPPAGAGQSGGQPPKS